MVSSDDKKSKGRRMTLTSSQMAPTTFALASSKGSYMSRKRFWFWINLSCFVFLKSSHLFLVFKYWLILEMKSFWDWFCDSNNLYVHRLHILCDNLSVFCVKVCVQVMLLSVMFVFIIAALCSVCLHISVAEI